MWTQRNDLEGKGRVGRRLLMLLALGVIGMFAFAACGGDDDSSAPAPAEPAPAEPAAPAPEEPAPADPAPAAADLKITHVAPQVGNPFYVPIEVGHGQAGEDLGIETQYVGPANADAQQQFAMIETATQEEVEGLVVNCGDPVAMVEAIDAAVDAGIIVATANTDCPTSKRAFFFGADFDAEGIITAELLKAYADENGITGPIKTAIGICFPGVEALNLRRDSFLNRAEELGLEIDFVGEFDTGLDTAQSLTVYENIVAGNPDIDALYGTCGVDTRNAGEMSARGENSDGETILAFGYDLLPDTLELVKTGGILWTLGQSPFDQGYEPTKAIGDFLLEGTALPEGFVQAKTEIVTTLPELEPVASEFEKAELVTDIDAIIAREGPYYTR